MDYFRAMHAFLAAAELGSFSKAARHMDIETSTLSRYIADLEHDLGIALFNRSTRGLVLTEGGHLFRTRTSDVLEHLAQARDETSALNQSPRGRLRVGVPRAFALAFLVPRLKAFGDQYPHIEVDMVFSDEPLHLIEADLDVAVRIGILADSQLVARRLAPHRLVLCAAPALLASMSTPTTPGELAGLPAVATGGALQRDLHLDDGQGTSVPLGLQTPPRFRVDDEDAAMQLALAGAGVTVLPYWQVIDAIRQDRLRLLLEDWKLVEKPGDSAIWLVYTYKKTVSSKVRAFVDFFAHEVAGCDAGLWG